MAQTIRAPSREPVAAGKTLVFLAGTMSPPGPQWRDEVTAALAHLRHVAVADPTRPDWDSTWREDASFAPFADQVRWELEMQDRADVVVVNFGGRPDGGGGGDDQAAGELPKAPVSLLELGLRVGRGRRCMVVCGDGYWKRGNVQLVCERYGVPMFGSVKALAAALAAELGQAA